MTALLDLIIEWVIGHPDELTPEQRARFVYLGRQFEAPDAIDAELAADAADRPKDAKP